MNSYDKDLVVAWPGHDLAMAIGPGPGYRTGIPMAYGSGTLRLQGRPASLATARSMVLRHWPEL